MKTISSKDNPTVKEAASLQEKKYRDALGLFLVEGPNMVRELLRYGGRIRFIFLKAGAGAEAQEIARTADGLTAVYELSEDAFLKIIPEKNSQGIGAVAVKNLIEAEEFFKTAGSKNLLVLDRIQDPGNMGTLIRSAEAFGFGGVMLVKGCADPYQPKAVRASAGSLMRMPLLWCSGAEEAVRLLKANDRNVFSACMEGELAAGEADLKERSAIIIGNEGNGISEELRSKSTGIYVPMEGNTESLNAAAAATVIMYESMRQRSE